MKKINSLQKNMRFDFLTFLFKAMTKDWFKYLPVVYKNEDKCYVQATSSFDESMNLNLAGKKL